MQTLAKWNPSHLWRILRLSKSYRLAVDRFVADATKDPRSKRLLNIFKAYSEPYDFEAETDVDVRDAHARELDQPSHKHLRTGAAEFLIEVSNLPHVQHFLRWYGDVLSFPVHYRTRLPNPYLLHAVWNLRPASRKDYKMSGANEVLSELAARSSLPSRTSNVIQIPIQINLNFSDAQIGEAAAEVLRATLKEHYNSKTDSRRLLTGKAPKWKTLDESIHLLEMRVDGKSQLSTAKQLSWDKKTSPATLDPIQLLKQKVSSREKTIREILKFFERTEPAQSNKNKVK